MARTTKSTTLKNAVKSALLEAIEKNEGAVRQIIEEAIEDALFGRAIQQGLRSRKITRNKVLGALSR